MVKTIDTVIHADGCAPYKAETGDWVDLATAREVWINPGEFIKISLGISMRLPDGYEAIVASRSSTFQRYKIIMANGIGVIDNSYAGTHDIWQFPAINMCDERVYIPRGARIAQFRIQKKQPDLRFHFVDKLNEIDRGGFGSTGR